MKPSVFKKFFFLSLTVFLLSVAYVGYMFLFGGNTISNENIDINVIGNTFVGGGEDLPLVIEVVNRNNTDLELVDLVVEYPKGASGGIFSRNERLRSSLGTISAGATRSENINVILYGEQGSNVDIQISLEYRLEGSNSIFVKEKGYEVAISSTPIDLVLDAPIEISPNQDIALNIRATLNSNTISPNAVLRVDYPVGFNFVSADPVPVADNNTWDLSKIKSGTIQEIKIVGKMVDVFDGEEKTFHAFTGLRDDQNKSELGVVLGSVSHTVAIKRPFIEARLVLNGNADSVSSINSKTVVTGQVEWRNNLDTKLNDLAIIARISGNAYDKKSIVAGKGFYNSGEDYLIWDKNSIPALADVAPGESGVVLFSVSPVPLFSANTGLISEPYIKVDVSLSAKRALEGNILQNLEDFESKTVRLHSDLGFAGKTQYYSGPFRNSGPLPPKADQETTYTVVWSISNTANRLSKATVRATIPPWVRYMDSIYPVTEDLVFDPSTREIVWNAGVVPRGAGLVEDKREVSFQLAIRPYTSHIGTSPVLVNTASLTAHDDFANVDLSGGRSALTTSVTGDQGESSKIYKVAE